MTSKFVAVLSTQDGTRKRFIALDRTPLVAGDRPIYKLVDREADAHEFETSGDAKFAAVTMVNARIGKPMTGGLNLFGIRKLTPLEVNADFVKRDGAIRAAQFMETSRGSCLKPIPEAALVFDWQAAGEELYAAFAVIIDQIDYTNQSCRPNEPIGGLLDPHLIEQAKEALSGWLNLRLKARSQNGDGVGG